MVGLDRYRRIERGGYRYKFRLLQHDFNTCFGLFLGFDEGPGSPRGHKFVSRRSLGMEKIDLQEGLSVGIS